MKYLYLSILLVGLFSCEKIVMKPNAKTDNEAVFNEYVKLVKEKYAMLGFKEVDIDFLADSIRPHINNTLNQDDFFNKLSIITYRLRDGHSALVAPISENNIKEATFDLYEGYPIAFNDTILKNHYTGSQVSTINNVMDEDDENKVAIIYGFLQQDSDIAYIRIPSFEVSLADEQLETVFSHIASGKGLIIDVRHNEGGDPSLATKIASYCMSKPTYSGFERFKTGPGANDFTDSPSTITPSESEYKYTKPIIVLTDRGCYSATTTLCYNLNPLPHVTFMGQRTGGGSGSVADGILANGWYWSLSTSEFIDYLGQHLDDGFDPDITVAFDNGNLLHDEILDAAILELQ